MNRIEPTETGVRETPALPPRRKRQAAVKRHSRRWLPYLGLVVLVGLIVAGLWPRPLPVETARAAIGLLRVTVNEEGKTRIKQRYMISAPVAGQLRRIPFKAGAPVKAGDTVLVIIDPVAPTLLDARTRAAAEARRDTAAANLDKAKASLAFAESELKRFQKLYSEQTVSIQELETAQLREATAAKEAASAESALRQAEAELLTGSGNLAADRTPREIKATVNGRVLRVFEESSRVVGAGTPLLEVGNPADLEIVVEVLSRDGAAINAGDKVEFDQWGGTKPLEGTVRLVEPAAFTKVSALGVEEQRVNVIADLTTPPEQRGNLGDNFRVEARIIVWENGNALKVPAGALFRQGDQWATFVVKNGRAELRRVKAGHSSGTETEVLEGLKQGEQVILYPGSRVRTGSRVEKISF